MKKISVMRFLSIYTMQILQHDSQIQIYEWIPSRLLSIVTYPR